MKWWSKLIETTKTNPETSYCICFEGHGKNSRRPDEDSTYWIRIRWYSGLKMQFCTTFYSLINAMPDEYYILYIPGIRHLSYFLFRILCGIYQRDIFLPWSWQCPCHDGPGLFIEDIIMTIMTIIINVIMI